MLPIYIPTYGRANRVRTVENFPPRIIEATTLVVRKEEASAYRATYPRLAQMIIRKPVTNIGETRQYIVDCIPNEAFVMMDDDLGFLTRRLDDPGKFLPASPSDITGMVKRIRTLLQIYAHVGVVGREGGNRSHPTLAKVTRMVRVLGYQRSVLREVKANFKRCPPREDFDVTLTLLRAGYANAVICDYAQGQPGSNLPGGCSDQRSESQLEHNAYHLASLHPGFVKVVKKTTKTAWGGGERTDVQIAWKKAYESSK